MKKLALFLVTAGMSLFGTAQICSITINPSDTTVCPGDSVHIVSFPVLVNGNQAFNFNGGAIPSGWSAGGGTAFATPCGQNPTATPYYWASTATSTPNITTAFFDVSCGGQLVFDMRYAIQGQASPCEGPDQANEGVSLQYSINNGVTWNNINYFQPDGQILPAPTGSTAVVVTAGQATPFTVWDTYSIQIPVAAQTTSTAFRWIQLASSSSVNDNWGLDNIFVNAMGAPCGNQAVVNWSNGLMDTTEFWVNTYNDTSFIAYVYDTAGNFMCQSAPIFVNVNVDQMTYSLVDTVYSHCPTTNPSAGVTNIGNSVAPYTVTWTDFPSTTNPHVLPTNGAEHDTIVYHVQITDGCNFIREDSVVMIVNKLINVDSVYSITASACANDGVVVGLVSGVTGQPLYNWNGPGASNPAFTNSSVWQNRAPGWYYFTVSDNVCSDSDSVYVDMLPPPVADFTSSMASGCDPLTVTFTNTSQNATTYTWNFGNGNIVTVNNMNPIQQTYNASATITLIASTSPNCADTINGQVAVVTCGCTNPTALNYNPLASVDDGSCILPDPVVILPNVFTPNNDGENDVFQLQVQNVSEVRLTITNRWGELVFQATGANPSWDGQINGNVASDGVYFVKYEADNIYKTVTLSGHGPIHLYRNK